MDDVAYQSSFEAAYTSLLAADRSNAPPSVARQSGWDERDKLDENPVSRFGDDRRGDCRAQEFCLSDCRGASIGGDI
jgi:hypothetical protein